MFYFIPGKAFYSESLYQKHANGAWCFLRKGSSRNLFFLWSWSWKPLQRSKLISEENLYISAFIQIFIHLAVFTEREAQWEVKQAAQVPYLLFRVYGLMGQGLVPRGGTEFKNVVSRGSLGC